MLDDETLQVDDLTKCGPLGRQLSSSQDEIRAALRDSRTRFRVGKLLPKYRFAEVYENDGQDDAPSWIAHDDRVYDVTGKFTVSPRSRRDINSLTKTSPTQNIKIGTRSTHCGYHAALEAHSLRPLKTNTTALRKSWRVSKNIRLAGSWTRSPKPNQLLGDPSVC